MPLGKRKLAALFSRATMRAAKRTNVGYSKYAKRMMGRVGQRHMVGVKPLGIRVRKLERLMETKETGAKTATNVAIPHNNLLLLFDLFENITQGSTDPMGPVLASANRNGDRITLKGVALRGFIENALDRSNVHYRVIVLKGAKGDIFNRDTIFKGMADNKMIDQINTERFTIVAQRVFNCTPANYAPSQVGGTGIPIAAQSTIQAPSGIATRMFKMWIPGTKFTRTGDIQYENNGTQCKFFDYKVLVFAYDWFGTPQDVNNVGKINEMWSKVYFKDA